MNRISTHLFGGLLLFVAAAAPAIAQRGMTSLDVARLHSVSDVAISPDGSMIAYILSVPRAPFEEESGAAWGELHLVGADGVSRPWVSGEETITGVQWLPDGQSISFLAKRSGDDERSLYRISARGGEAVKVTGHPTAIAGYSWSPDGSRVAFTAREQKPEARRDLEKQGFNPIIYEEEALFERLYIHDVASEGEARAVELEGNVTEIHWSPAGDRLLFAVAPTPGIDDRYMRRRIHVWDIAGNRLATSVDTLGKLGDLRWSPDGSMIAVISASSINDPSEGRLMVVPSTGGDLRELIADFPGHIQNMEWRDRDTIVFIGDQGVQTHVEQIDTDGSNRRMLIRGGEIVFTGLSVSEDGAHVAFVGESPAHPSEVFSASGSAWQPSRVTRSNPWLSDVRLARQEVVQFKARDGLELEGILIHPLDRREGRRYPLIMAVHGGPEAHHRNGWMTTYSLPGQLGAAKGYAVFYTNYRGSTGRGVDFSMLSQKDPAGKEFDDLVDAVDHLIATGLVDRSKVGITGGSYGGYASAWAATYYTERFAAAVMNVGISDKISKIGTSDIPNELYLVHERVWPWEAWDELRERSPLFHIEKARTPLLIMHGEDDTRVHPSQSLMLYRYLKILGKTPVRLVLYPGEGHGYSKSAARLDYNVRMIQWFDHYLKGPGGEPPAPALEYPRIETATSEE